MLQTSSTDISETLTTKKVELIFEYYLYIFVWVGR